MPRFTVALSGEAAVAKALGMFPDTIHQALDGALRDAASLVLQTAQATAPRGKTGRLAQSLRLKALKPQPHQIGYGILTGTRAALGLKPGATGYYPAHVSLGFLRRIEFGTRHVPARPFLRRALLDNQAAVVSRLAQALQRRLA
jgi:HK97 gp10 family phage protein